MTARFDAATVARLSALTDEPEGVKERRRAAFDRFDALPWPDQSLEEWQHTDLHTLDLVRFDAIPQTSEKIGGLDELPADVRAIAQAGTHSAMGIRLDANLVHVEMSDDARAAGV